MRTDWCKLVQFLFPPLVAQISSLHFLNSIDMFTRKISPQALGTLSESAMMSEFLLLVIQLSTDTQQPSHVYLLEDGLELWLTLLENSTAMSQPLLLLYNNMNPLLEGSTENLRTCFYIIQAYILLAPDLFLQESFFRVQYNPDKSAPVNPEVRLTLSVNLCEYLMEIFHTGPGLAMRSGLLVIWRSGGNASSVCIAELCSADLALACSTLFLPL
ncbi:Importin-11 [Homalodisca vitripennis]|nr:Importin-11 [Homalodisca vitripennis]